MKKILIHIILLFISHFSFAQIDGNAVNLNEKGDTILLDKLKAADSILLISHDVPEDYWLKVVPDERIDKKHKLIKHKTMPIIGKDLKLIKNGRVNEDIVHKTVLLDSLQRNSLIKIFSIPVVTIKDIQVPSRCFMPHHGIMIFKNGETSFVEICFGCRDNATSGDIGGLNYFSKMRWIQLESLYNGAGFNLDEGTTLKWNNKIINNK